MIIKILFLLFLPVLIFGDEISDSTTTVVVPPTTAQILIDGINDFADYSDKLNEVNKELAKNPDEVTGQSLTDYKANIIIEEKHRKQGKNYIGYINYPVYKRKK
jgi:hypothetical protein